MYSLAYKKEKSPNDVHRKIKKLPNTWVELFTKIHWMNSKMNDKYIEYKFIIKSKSLKTVFTDTHEKKKKKNKDHIIKHSS